MRNHSLSCALVATILSLLSGRSFANAEDSAAIAALDTAYQLAVERSDWQAMDKILHRDFALVLGNGRTRTRAQLLEAARERNIVFEAQVEEPGTQTVRLFGKGTATVTALLRLKGKRTKTNEVFDFKLWFTDTYVRTPEGWRYAFGQASSPLEEVRLLPLGM